MKPLGSRRHLRCKCCGLIVKANARAVETREARTEIDQGELDKWEHLELSKMIAADMAERSQNDDSSRFREHEGAP